MYTHRHHNPVQLLAILALIVTTACGEDSPTPTAPGSAVSAIAPRPDMLVGAALKPDGKLNAVRITSLTINPTALTIGGAGTPGTLATWTATIENPKKQGLSNVFVQARFVVYLPSGNISGWRGAGGGLIQCPGRSFGFVPSGTCTISGTATPSNDAGGGGFLVPDDTNHDARFELELLQDTGEPILKLLSKRAADVTLFFQIS